MRQLDRMIVLPTAQDSIPTGLGGGGLHWRVSCVESGLVGATRPLLAPSRRYLGLPR